MNYVRAIGMSILTYLASMLVGMIINMIFQVNMTDAANFPPYIWVISLVVLIAITYLFSTRYFKGKGVVASAVNGLLLGVVMLITSFVLDMVFIQLYSMSPQLPADYNRLAMYQNIWFWMGVAVMIVTTILVGRKHSPHK